MGSRFSRNVARIGAIGFACRPAFFRSLERRASCFAAATFAIAATWCIRRIQPGTFSPTTSGSPASPEPLPFYLAFALGVLEVERLVLKNGFGLAFDVLWLAGIYVICIRELTRRRLVQS